MDGFLLLDKPVALSSAAVVAKVKRHLLLVAKVGHTGTLDPFAEGLLPIAVGKATKLIDYLPKADKVYRATLKLGEETETLDPEGKITGTFPVPEHLTSAEIEHILKRLVGPQAQVPPLYSAVKSQGRPLYEYARRHISPEHAPKARQIVIQSCRLLGWDCPYLAFEIACSPGTYVRVFGVELARALGSGGHLRTLRRLASDGFSIQGAIKLDALNAETARTNCIPIEKAIGHLPHLSLNTVEEAHALRQGKKHVVAWASYFQTAPDPSVPIAVFSNQQLIAMMHADRGEYLRIQKII